MVQGPQRAFFFRRGCGMTTQQSVNVAEGGDVPWWRRRGVAWRHDLATATEPPARLALFQADTPVNWVTKFSNQ